MPVSKGKSTLRISDIQDRMPETVIASYYLGIRKIPCLIKSPLRPDNHPSFGLYTRDGKSVFFRDFSTGDNGGLMLLLSKIWGVTVNKAMARVYDDIPKMGNNVSVTQSSPGDIVKRMVNYDDTVDLQCKVREWKKHDIEYWESYGVPLRWLKYAEVYPISHKFVIKGKNRYMFPADRHAYAFVERKEGHVTLKIYQPFNRKGFKWCNKHDRSVIGLWTKVPEKGDRLCVCSSLKDALCLWANVGIPSVYIQGEGYSIGNTALRELKRRFKKVYICLDNDEAGLSNAERLSRETGFTNVVLPPFENGKDLSDYYREYGKKCFIDTISQLFALLPQTSCSDLPFEVEY